MFWFRETVNLVEGGRHVFVFAPAGGVRRGLTRTLLLCRIRVQAVNAVGPGAFSGVVKETTLSLPPPPPPLEVTHTSHNFVRLRWGDAKQQTDRIVYSLECEAKNGE